MRLHCCRVSHPFRAFCPIVIFYFPAYLIVAICACGLNAQDVKVLRLFVLGSDSGYYPYSKAGDEILIPVGDWMKWLPVEVEGLGDDAIAIKRRDGKRIKMHIGSQEASFDGKREKLLAAPAKVDGKLGIPIKGLCEFIGLSLYFDEAMGIGYICATLSSVEVKPSDNGWLVEAKLTAQTSYSINRLSNPERVYIDANHCIVGLQKQGEVIGRRGSIERVRVGQYSLAPPIARVVLDMDWQLEFQDATAKGERSLADRIVVLVRDPQVAKAKEAKINGVKLEPTDGIVRGLISVEGMFRYRAFTLRDPDRIVIDFKDAELALPAGAQSVPKNETVKEVRVGTPEVDGEIVARVVFELFKPVRYRVTERRLEGIVAVEFGASNLSGISIVIDPGHGGTDPGALSPVGMFESRLVEKDLTLDIALRLQRMLSEAGAIVTMTRTGDYYVSLDERVSITNKLTPAAFVSIHLNSFPTPGAKSGIETYYFTPQSEPLAGAIHRNLVAMLGLPDNGIRQRRFYVLRNTIVPAVLVEACYLNHPTDGALVMNEQFREKIALAILNGLEEYFGNR